MAEQIKQLKYKANSYLERGNTEKALPLLETLSDLNDADAQASLASMYTFGNGVDLDYDKAFHYTLMAANNSHPEMMINLALLYKKGLGCEVDLEQSVYWMKKAAYMKCEDAYYGLALAYFYGEGVRQDYEVALDLAIKCSSSQSQYAALANSLVGDIEYEKALDLYRKGYIKEGLEWFKELANKGHLSSMVFLSCELSKQCVAGFTKEDAVYWARKAADQDEPAGMYNLGIYYWYGTGVERDRKIAFEWMRNAAKAGYAMAYLPLCQMYILSNKGEVDLKEALYWAVKAKEANPKEPDIDMMIEDLHKMLKR